MGAVDIDKVSIIDSGGRGTGVPGFMGQLPSAVISLAEQIENATGVDLFKALRPDPDGSSESTGGEYWIAEASTDEVGSGPGADG